MEAHVTHAPRMPRQASRLPAGVLGDERLARMAGGGSQRAFAALYDRYHQQLYRYCRAIVRNDADAQDALQSAFAGALAALQRGQRNAPLRPWLFRIAHNEAISLLRHRRPQDELPHSLQDSSGSTEERAEERARLAQLMADLRELPLRQRSALVMRELSGLSHEEIAIALSTSPGAAKQAIFEARRALLDCAEGRAMTCEDVCRTISHGDRRALRARRLRAHLRQCSGCAAFAAAIPARRGDLQMLAPPLAPGAATGLLAHLLGAGSSHAGGGLAGVSAGAVGKSLGAALATKAAAGVAVLTIAAAGLTGALIHAKHRANPSPLPRGTQPAATARDSGAATGGAHPSPTPTQARRTHRRVSGVTGTGAIGALGGSSTGGASSTQPGSVLLQGLHARVGPSNARHAPQRYGAGAQHGSARSQHAHHTGATPSSPSKGSGTANTGGSGATKRAHSPAQSGQPASAGPSTPTPPVTQHTGTGTHK